MIRRVDIIESLSLRDYAAVGHLAPSVQQLRSEAELLVDRFIDRRVWMLNSTPRGGGVAEMLPKMVSMLKELGVDTRWLVMENLPRVFAVPDDIEARGRMMAAAAMGAVAFQKGLGAIHAISHPVGAVYGTHHGTTNACVMPAVIDFNRPAIEERIAAAAAYLGISGGFEGFRARVVEMNASLGIPAGLTAMGVEAARVPELAAMAIEDPSAGGNPVPLTRENTEALIRACL